MLKRKRLRELEIAALAAQAAANGGELPLMQLKGFVVETKVLEDRKQVRRVACRKQLG